jgi:hypothetical protein
MNITKPGKFSAALHMNLVTSPTDHSIKSVTFSAQPTITVPKWPALEKQGKKTKAEWKRFLDKLKNVHERGHLMVLHESVAKIAHEMELWHRATLKDGGIPTAATLQNKYQVDWYPKYVDPPQDKYDRDTDDGRKQGAFFDSMKAD